MKTAMYAVLGIALGLAVLMFVTPAAAPAVDPAVQAAALHERMLDQTVLVTAPGQGHGSGVVIGPRTILTVEHVASMADEFEIEFRDGRKIKARTLWAGNGDFDAAVLYLDEPVDVAPARVSCAPVDAGTELLAIGNPLDQRWVESLVRVGSSRPVAGQEFVTLVMGFVVPGMSGGPVFNAAGQVVGLSQAIRLIPFGRGASITGLAILTSNDALCAAGLAA